MSRSNHSAVPASVRPNRNSFDELRECDNFDEDGMENLEDEGNQKGEAEESMEMRPIRKKRLPDEPSQSEIDDHYLSGHTPFRQWCSACVMGAAQSNHHVKSEHEDQAIPVVSIDYAYMESQSEDKGMPMVITKDRSTKAVYADVVQEKGVNQYAVRRVSKNLQLIGHDKIILKTDNERSILALKEAVIREKPVTIIPEESPVKESQSNGEVENAVKQVQAKVRTLRLAIESRYNISLKRDDCSIPWMIKHAADMIRRMLVGKDGRTAYERIKGKKFKGELIEFGEVIWYMKPGTKGVNKFDSRWETGIWLGIRDESGESIVGTSEGVIKVRSIRRKGIAKERWDAEQFNKITGTPWQPNPSIDIDAIRSKGTLPPAPKERVAIPAAEPIEIMRRRVRITKDIVV